MLLTSSVVNCRRFCLSPRIMSTRTFLVSSLLFHVFLLHLMVFNNMHGNSEAPKQREGGTGQLQKRKKEKGEKDFIFTTIQPGIRVPKCRWGRAGGGRAMADGEDGRREMGECERGDGRKEGLRRELSNRIEKGPYQRPAKPQLAPNDSPLHSAKRASR